MILLHVTVKTKEDVSNQFEQSLCQVIDDAHKMAGCLTYEWYRFPISPREYVIYGEFDTRENFERYLRSKIVKRIGAELIPLLDTPPAFKHFEAKVLESS